MTEAPCTKLYIHTYIHSTEIDNFFLSQNIVNIIRSRIAGSKGRELSAKPRPENLKREIAT